MALIDESESNYGLAEKKYRAALKTDPAYRPALFNLAIILTSSAPEEAIGLYEDAVAANKKDSAAWLNLGLLLRSEGQVRKGNEAVLMAIAGCRTRTCSSRRTSAPRCRPPLPQRCRQRNAP